MQINNATGIKRPDQCCEVTAGEKERLWYSTVKKKNLFHRQDAVQDPATQESTTETLTVQWSSNVKGGQVSPAQDILEVFFLPLDFYVLSE